MRKRTKNRKRPTPRLSAAGAALLAGVCLAVQTQAARRPAGAVCFPLQTAVWRCRTDTAPGRTPLPGRRAFHKESTLPVPKARRCLLSGAAHVLCTTQCQLWRLHAAAASGRNRGAVCPSAVYLYVRPVKRYSPGSFSARQGRPACATGAHLYFELYRQEQPATRRAYWDCRMHRRIPLRMAPSLPGPGAAVRGAVWAAAVRRQRLSALGLLAALPP